MKNNALLTIGIILIGATFSVAQKVDSLTDLRDGKVYKTVEIGTQTWMAENMAFKTKIGCWAYNDSIKYVSTYGYLYNWEAAKNVCPTGWNLPDDKDWDILFNSLGGKDVSADKIRAATGWFNWNKTSLKDLNSSGFNALPSGSRDADDNYEGVEYRCFWWTSTLYDPGMHWYVTLEHSGKDIGKNAMADTYGYSVRCIKNK